MSVSLFGFFFVVRPLDTLACCWHVKQATDKQSLSCPVNLLGVGINRGKAM